MSDIEAQIRDTIAGRASEVFDGPDWDDLQRRVTRRDRRRRVAGGVATALIAALFAAVATTTDLVPGDDKTVAATPTTADASPATTTPPQEHIEVGTDDRPLAERTGETLPATGRGFPAGPISLAFTRTVGDRTVRVMRADLAPAPDDGIDWWARPRWCSDVGWVRAEGDGSLPVAEMGLVDLLPTGRARVAVVAEDGTAVVLAQAPEATASVHARFPDGGEDTTRPVDGVAVLHGSARGPAASPNKEQPIVVEFLDADGDTIASEAATVELSPLLDSGFGIECEPPLAAMPAVGSASPADPDAARAEIITAYTTMYDASQPPEARSEYVTPPDLVARFMEQYKHLWKTEVLDPTLVTLTMAAAVEVRTVTFTSATTAAVSYDMLTFGEITAKGRIGEAVVVDGKWRVAGTTYCRDIATIAFTCG